MMHLLGAGISPIMKVVETDVSAHRMRKREAFWIRNAVFHGYSDLNTSIPQGDYLWTTLTKLWGLMTLLKCAVALVVTLIRS